MGTKSMLQKASGVVNQWLLKWVQEAGAGNLVTGGRICAPLIAGAIVVLGLLTVWKVPERSPPPASSVPRRISLWEGWAGR